MLLRLRQRFHALVVQAEVQDGVHHAGHGELRARAHADQQRIVARAELLPLQLLQLRQRLVHLAVDVCGDTLLAHVFAAGFGLDGESRRHGQPGVGHLGQARAFAAQLVLHLAVAVGLATAEEINVLGCRWF